MLCVEDTRWVHVAASMTTKRGANYMYVVIIAL